MRRSRAIGKAFIAKLATPLALWRLEEPLGMTPFPRVSRPVADNLGLEPWQELRDWIAPVDELLPVVDRLSGHGQGLLDIAGPAAARAGHSARLIPSSALAIASSRQAIRPSASNRAERRNSSAGMSCRMANGAPITHLAASSCSQ
jgi:hypothetical protein